MKTAVIIAGGEGLRMLPMTEDKPKTLVEVSGKPLLYWIISWLKRYGIDHVVIGVAYKKERIMEFMKQNDSFGLKVNFSEHTVDGGTAEAFKLAIKRFVKDENFVAMNGDELTNMDLDRFIEDHKRGKKTATLALASFQPRFGVVSVGDDKTITGFQYGKKLPAVPVSIGVYVFNKRILDMIPDRGSIEDDVFRKLAERKDLHAYMLPDGDEWFTVNTIKDIKEAEDMVTLWNGSK